ncbi:MAG TPA: FixH family protein [Chitinophagaceae bacterium]|nr:FixH family protein [Chitinophagaceae bacterium]
MKINWGHKIAAVYILFVAGTLFLAYKASHEEFDLVTKDYYGAELKYQQVIDQKARVAALSGPVQVEQHGQQLQIRFPRDFAGQAIKGEVYLYCPADERKDFRQPFSTTDLTCQAEAPGGTRGLYDLKLSWEANGKTYYQEQKIVF